VNGKKKPLPPEAQELIDRYEAKPPSEEEIASASTMTEDDLEEIAGVIGGFAQLSRNRDDARLREAARAETRVAFPVEAFDELGYLVGDSTEDPTDLPSAVVLAWQAAHGRLPGAGDDVSCEGAEEGEEWAFSCRGLELDQLLGVVRQAIPPGWTAEITPVPPAAFAGTAIAMTRR
jgi:hypothetical protein